MIGLKRIELLVFLLLGKIVAVFGGTGVIITLMFDRIARGLPISLGWLQIVGLLGFTGICMFGLYADIFLNDTIKPMIKDYLES